MLERRGYSQISGVTGWPECQLDGAERFVAEAADRGSVTRRRHESRRHEPGSARHRNSTRRSNRGVVASIERATLTLAIDLETTVGGRCCSSPLLGVW